MGQTLPRSWLGAVRSAEESEARMQVTSDQKQYLYYVRLIDSSLAEPFTLLTFNYPSQTKLQSTQFFRAHTELTCP